MITAVLAIGGFAERSKMGPVLVFIFVWLTLVYCPIACWTWVRLGVPELTRADNSELERMGVCVR
jgi:ammonia channel protein AmtB